MKPLPEDAKMILIATAVAITLIGAVLMLSVAVKAVRCEASWNDSGYEAKYEILSGCRVRMPDGRMLPEAVVIKLLGRESK
jgi:hypothetical protein